MSPQLDCYCSSSPFTLRRDETISHELPQECCTLVLTLERDCIHIKTARILTMTATLSMVVYTFTQGNGLARPAYAVLHRGWRMRRVGSFARSVAKHASVLAVPCRYGTNHQEQDLGRPTVSITRQEVEFGRGRIGGILHRAVPPCCGSDLPNRRQRPTRAWI